MLPFKIEILDKQIDEILKKVENYPWHEMPDDGGWQYGTNLDYMKELCSYWLEKFDWRKHMLNHFEADNNVCGKGIGGKFFNTEI